MDTLEKELREKIVRILLTLAIACVLLDIFFMFESLFNNDLSMEVPKYILKRICLPFSVNLASFFIAKFIIKSEKFSNDVKNMACSFALCTIAGSMAVFHSFFTQLWVVPSMVLLFCSVFHNPKINRAILVYCCILVVCAALYISSERPGTLREYMNQCIVVEGITILASLVAWQVQKYQMSVQALIMNSLKNEEKYRQRLEFDALTRVHSRVYIREIVDKTFGLKNEQKPVGLAILDLDNFKSVNDTYGHNNGDKVLRALGGLLNEYATEDVVVGRFGGEEFVIIFKGEDQNQYYDILEEIRDKFSKYSFDFMDRRLSFSSGLIKCMSETIYEKAFNEADKALYVSKNNGKNRITVKEI